MSMKKGAALGPPFFSFNMNCVKAENGARLFQAAPCFLPTQESNVALDPKPPHHAIQFRGQPGKV